MLDCYADMMLAGYQHVSTDFSSLLGSSSWIFVV